MASLVSRLTGERGIPILPKVFEKVKFKGRGHEVRSVTIDTVMIDVCF